MSLFFIGLYNIFIHYAFCFENEPDKFIILFLLIDLLLACIAGFYRCVDKNYNIIQKIIDQYNKSLKQNFDAVENIRRCFAFLKIKCGLYTILYFKNLGLEKEVEKVRLDLINFGLDEEIVKDDNKLAEFLKGFGEGKYLLIVDPKNKKFIFVRKEDDTNSTKS